MQKVFKVLAGLIVVVGIGLVIGWWASRGTPTTPPQPPPSGESPSAHPGGTAAKPHGPEAAQTNLATGPATGSTTSTGPMPANLVTNWDDKLDEILGSETDDTNKVRQLFEMFPNLPAEGQVEVAQHLSNLVDDSDYAPLGKLLEDAKLPEDVLDVLMADLLNRPNGVKLPMFLEIAKTPGHAKAEEAKDLLELYLDEDYGTDWSKWQQKTQDWLKDNPD